MADVPYRLWSDEAPAAPPAPRTIVAKLKPKPAARALGALADAEPPTRLDHLLANARLRAVRPVFPTEGGARRLSALRVAADAGGGIRHSRGLVTIEVAKNEDPRRMARHLESLGAEVEYAYVPRPRRMFAKKKKTSPKADPLLSRQWSHSAVRIAQARQLSGFVDATKITVAVVDSGIDTTHPDLESVVAEHRNFVKGESARDFAGHGTHVAGIVAAAMNNGIGVSGLCAARILGLKVLPDRVEWDAAGYYRALGYCIGRAQVVNLSLGDESFDPGERDVIVDLLEANIVVVAAMGNEFDQGNPIEYPAALEGVCAVGATDHADRRGGFSNTGKHIALAAPGVSILSTTPTYSYAHGLSDYDSFDGTSMATPHVSAAAALLLAEDPRLTPDKVVKKLQRSADRVPGQKKRADREFGWGRLNIAAAIKG